MALAHMHVPLAPPPSAGAASEGVYTSSLKEMDSLVGTIRSASDDTDKNNTLIWFTG